MKINDFNYHLPKKLIAQGPVKSRDKSRFLIYDSKKDSIYHQRFFDLVNFVNPGDLIVINSTKVFPARLIGKKETGGKIELLLLNQVGKNWKVLIGGSIKKDQRIVLGRDLNALILDQKGKEKIAKFNKSGDNLLETINKIGKMPIPPYIKNTKLNESNLKKQYQTIYAKNGFSSAAPTAGMHFSREQVSGLKKKGIKFAEICLNIGLGTFAPISDQKIKNKKLHFENFSIPYYTIKKIIETRKNGGKIIAVGTTTVRALETLGTRLFKLKKPYSGSTNLFIQPGFIFKIVDELITNFHLPESSLMMLVAAFLENKSKSSKSDYGRSKLLELYSNAIKNTYRFYSFGDAMMIK